MSERKNKSAWITVSVIAAVMAVSALTAGSILSKQKNMAAKYDGMANVVEDYSFVLGCQNTVKCEVNGSGDYNREYVYNTYYDGDDKVIFKSGIFRNSYEYEKKELFKGINSVKPFPDAALPTYSGTRMEFRHYKSDYEPELNYDPENNHDRVSVSFNKPISCLELSEFNKRLGEAGYAVKFCWVDTYLPDEVPGSSKYAAGRPVPETSADHDKYAGYETAYGFLLYDHDYLNRTEFEEPEKKFIDIITADHDENFMSKELSGLAEKLSVKDELDVDSLEIIGVVLEKQNGQQFSLEEVQKIKENSETVSFIYS